MVYRVLNEIDCFLFTRSVKFDMVSIITILFLEDRRIFIYLYRDRVSQRLKNDLVKEKHSKMAVQDRPAIFWLAHYYQGPKCIG